MEVKFTKNQLRCLRPILSQVHSQEQTLEVRLPDAYPDIGKVLGCWGQSVIRGKEWRNNGISANGGVMCWVLYAPEDGTQPRVLDAWIPFQCRWDFAENAENGTITLQPMLSNMDARSISARKMMLRAGIDTRAQAMETVNMELAEPGEVPEDVQLLTRKYPADLPVEAGEKQVLLEENLTLPAGDPPIHKFVNYTLSPEITEQKVLSNRLVFRGDAVLRALYMTEDGTLHTWNTTIPFSQYTELDREYGAHATAWVLPVVTALEMNVGEDGNIHLHAGMAAQYIIFDEKILEMVEDAYSPNREIVPQFEELKIPMLLDEANVELQAESNKAGQLQQIISLQTSAACPRLQSGMNGTEIKLDGHFQMLYRDEEGQLQGECLKFESNVPFASANENRTEVWAGNASTAEYAPGAEGMRMSCRIPVKMQVYSGKPVTFVSGVEMGELREPDGNRPSIILRRAGDEGLWALAKSTGSTMEAIRMANHLTEEPEVGEMLLIPVI